MWSNDICNLGGFMQAQDHRQCQQTYAPRYPRISQLSMECLMNCCCTEQQTNKATIKGESSEDLKDVILVTNFKVEDAE